MQLPNLEPSAALSRITVGFIGIIAIGSLALRIDSMSTNDHEGGIRIHTSGSSMGSSSSSPFSDSLTDLHQGRKRFRYTLRSCHR